MADLDAAATWLLPVLEALERYPRLVRCTLGPLAAGPVGKRLRVLTRAYLGATAFEAHDVDVARGRIGLGGVDEVIFSSRFIEFFHQEIASRVGAETKDQVLYEVGRRGGKWEVAEALRHGRWAPRFLAELIASGRLLETARRSPRVGRLFDRVMSLALRLIINEGGWGAASFELSRRPIRVTLRDSQEARWVRPADRPACFLSAGVVAGYASGICGEELHAQEVACSAAGAPACVFEVDR